MVTQHRTRPERGIYLAWASSVRQGEPVDSRIACPRLFPPTNRLASTKGSGTIGRSMTMQNEAHSGLRSRTPIGRDHISTFEFYFLVPFTNGTVSDAVATLHRVAG